MNKTIFFDVWWTIIDSDNVFVSILNTIWLEWEQHEEEFVINFLDILKSIEGWDEFKDVKKILTVIVRNMCEKYNKTDLSDLAPDLYKKIFLNTSKLFPDTREVLQALKDLWWQLVIVSDADADVLHQELNQFWLVEFFDVIIVSSEIWWYKPSNKTIAAIWDRVTFDPEKSFFIGDSMSDKETAEKLKTKFIYARHWKQLSKISWDYDIDNLNEMLEITKTTE